jgi:hypothetical protein
MVASRHHNVGQYHILLTGNKSCGNVAKLKYLGRTVTNQNYSHKEIKSTLNLGNRCSHSLQRLSSPLISKNIKIEIYKTIY